MAAGWPASVMAKLPDLRLFLPGTTRQTIERAHPQCRKFRETHQKGARCTVYSVQYDAGGVQSSLGWCMKKTACIPRWIYHFDPKQRLLRVDLHIESGDVDGVAFVHHQKLTQQIFARLKKKYGKPSLHRDFRRTHRHLKRLPEDSRLRLSRAVWRTKNQRVLMSADVFNHHHPLARTRVVLRPACASPACKKRRR